MKPCSKILESQSSGTNIIIVIKDTRNKDINLLQILQ